MADASAPLGVTYYPACIVNLLIRFDESLHKAANEQQIEQAKVAAAADSTAYVQMPHGDALFTTPANVAGSPILGRIPLRGSVELNNIRQPGSFNLTFDYRDLPIDPRIVRSVGIEIFMDTVRANDFAQNIQKGIPTQRRVNTTQMLGHVPLTATPDNLVLKGVVDTWQVQHTASGSTATLQGRDLVGVMLNTPITPTMLQEMAKGLTDKTIVDVVRALVNTIGTWKDLIDVEASDSTMWPGNEVPIVAVSDKRLNPGTLLYETTSGATAVTQANGKQAKKAKPRNKNQKARVRSSADGQQARVSVGGNQNKLNVWDLITRYCNLVAAVPTFKIKQTAAGQPFKSCLMIIPQWGLYDYFSTSAEVQAKAPNPFRESRNIVGGTGETRIRRLHYGHNIEELTLERKYQGITARAVEAVSYDSSSKKRGERLISAVSTLRKSYAEQAGTSPPIAEGSRVPVRAGVSPSGLSSQDEVLRIEVKGVTNVDDLERIANGLYDEIMRGETGGSVRTRSLASFGGTNEDPDLLRIRPRDPLLLSMNLGPMPAQTRDPTRAAQGDRDPTELVRAFTDQGMAPDLANAVAYTSTNQVAELQNAFRVNSVTFDWDVKSGISLSIDFHNYIVPRNSILPGRTAEATPAVMAPTAVAVSKAPPTRRRTAVPTRRRRR